ncbi:MAG TPA: MOSC domain-containing protein [Tepidisphaeraceae bacterium]|nr:MOSC domain-containing protein [Tepidisphaeraceae bacterium]
MLGKITAIRVRDERRKETRAIEVGELVVGEGLRGDRYAETLSKKPSEIDPGREVTLIESEAIDAANLEANAGLDHAQSRRNLLTRGVRLNDLVGKEFKVGETILKGIEPCHPCMHLEKMTKPGVMKALKDRGGLRATVVSGGTIRVGDVVEAN